MMTRIRWLGCVIALAGIAAGSAIGLLPGTALATVIAAAGFALLGTTVIVRRWLFGRWNAH